MFKDIKKNLEAFRTPVVEKPKSEESRKKMELEILAKTREAIEGKVADPFKDAHYLLVKKLLEIADMEDKPADEKERKYLGSSGQETYYAEFDLKEESGDIKSVKVYNAAGEEVESLVVTEEEPLSNVEALAELVDKLKLDSVSYKLLVELKIIELPPKEEEPEKPAEEPEPEEPKAGEEEPVEEPPAPEESVNLADFKADQSIFINGFGGGIIREIKDDMINVDLDLGANVTFKDLLKTQIMEAPIDVAMSPKAPGAVKTAQSPTAAKSPGTNMFPSPEDKDAIKQGQGSYAVDKSGGKRGDPSLKNLKVIPGKVDKDAVKQGAGSISKGKTADPKLQNLKPDYTKTLDKDAVKQGASSIDKDRFVGKTGAPKMVNMVILSTKIAEKIWNFLFENPNSDIDSISGKIDEDKDQVITTMGEMADEFIIQRTDEYHPMVRNPGRGRGMGRGGPRQGIGGPVNCTCPACGNTIPHVRGLPCTQVDCPKCGTRMVGTSESVKKFKGKKKVGEEISDFEIEAVDEKDARDLFIAQFPDAEITELEEMPPEAPPKEEPVRVGPSKEAQKVEITGVNTVEDAEGYLKKLKVKTKTKVNLKDKEAVVYSVEDNEVARYDIKNKILTINKVAEGVIPKLDKPVDAATIKNLIEQVLGETIGDRIWNFFHAHPESTIEELNKELEKDPEQDKIADTLKDMVEKGSIVEKENKFSVKEGKVPDQTKSQDKIIKDLLEKHGLAEAGDPNTHSGLEKIDAKVLESDYDILLKGVTDRATAENFSKSKNGITIRDSQDPTKFMVVVKKVTEPPVEKKKQSIPELEILVKALATVTEKSVEDVKKCWDKFTNSYLTENKKTELQPEDRKIILEKVKAELGIGTVAKVEEQLAKKDFSAALKEIGESSKKEIMDSLGKLFLVQQMDVADKKSKLLEKLIKNESKQ